MVCEQFLSLYDLQLDGLVQDLIFEFRNSVVATERDRVEFCSDGSYTLLPPKNKKQNDGRKRAAPDSATSSAPAARKKARASDQVVILLDDD